jgi:capsular polysaccharide biosynthesis protein
MQDQWNLFASSMGVVGPHGAGLTNMMVMKPRSVVVEVSHCKNWSP